MRPKGEASENAEQRETGAGLPARRERGPETQAQQQEKTAQDQGRRVEGRRQNRHQQKVGRRTGHEHGRGQRRRFVEGLRDTVGEGNEAEAEKKDGEPERFGGGPHQRHEGRGDPGVEGRPVGLAPERDPSPEVAGHEADDRGVAVDRSPQGLDPEGHAHHHAEQDGGGQAPARALHRSLASSPGGEPLVRTRARRVACVFEDERTRAEHQAKARDERCDEDQGRDRNQAAPATGSPLRPKLTPAAQVQPASTKSTGRAGRRYRA